MTSPTQQKKRKTRHSSGSKVSDYLGGGKELLPSEVPTLRSALQKALLLQEEFMFQADGDRPNFSIREIMGEVVSAVFSQWHKANAKFVPPVTVEPKSLENRLVEAWEKVSLVARGRASKLIVNTWKDKLEKLLDITICRCDITLCTDSSSPCSGQLEP